MMIWVAKGPHPAHPDSERHFQIFATPHVHAEIICTNLIEILAIDGKKTAGHGG